MAMALPALMFGASILKSKMDSDAATSQDDAMRRAGQAKIDAMRQGAGQMENYRQQLPPQMMQAMQNQMGAYGGAQNVLAQMYGGRPGAPMGQMPGAPAAGSFRAMGNRTLLGQMGAPGPAINPGTPGGARAGANPYFGERFVPRMGFGGEMPLPAQLLRRKV